MLSKEFHGSFRGRVKKHRVPKIGVFHPLICLRILGKSTRCSTGTQPLGSCFWAEQDNLKRLNYNFVISIADSWTSLMLSISPICLCEFFPRIFLNLSSWKRTQTSFLPKADCLASWNVNHDKYLLKNS